MNVLVSFCNIDTTKVFSADSNISPLAVIDPQSGQVRWIKVPITAGLCGFTGLTKSSKHIFIASQSPDCAFVYILEQKTLKVVRTQKLSKVKDAHSIFYQHGELQIVSTGNNSIFTYSIDKNLKLKYKKTLYKFTENKQDTIHINSITKFNRDYYFSAFGKKRDNLNTSTKDGYIYNLSKCTQLWSPIYHPHSLAFYNSDFYYCESKKSTVLKNGKDWIEVKEGYTRGLAINHNSLVFGTSIPRIKSRSTGNEITSIIDPNQQSCRIFFITKYLFFQRLVKIFNLSDQFNEIYDIMEIEYTGPYDTNLHEEKPSNILKKLPIFNTW